METIFEHELDELDEQQRNCNFFLAVPRAWFCSFLFVVVRPVRVQIVDRLPIVELPRGES